MTARKTRSTPYEVGYGKPPRHMQFRKGQSGNPGGRPRRMESVNTLLLREAYRPITVKMAGRAVTLPAVQAIVRSQIRLAAEGNVQAQRAVLAAVQTVEREKAEEEEAEAWKARREAARQAAAQAVREAEATPAAERAAPAPDRMSYAEAARRVSFLLGLDRPKDKGETCKIETGAQGKETATEERDSGQQRDAVPMPPADSASESENETASADPSVMPPPSTDPPTAALPWRSPPPRPDRYARHAAREAPLSPEADLRSPLRTLRDRGAVRHRTGNLTQPSDISGQEGHLLARQAAKTTRFPDKFPVFRECRGLSSGRSRQRERGG
jgi:hypothetical protein